MKRTVVWKNRFILFGMMVMALLFISGCSGDDLTPVKSAGHDPTTPWTATATEDTWLTSNPFGDKHDGGWVYSAREDVIYAIYGDDNSGQTLYRIDHIGHTSEIATTFLYGRHGGHPVIDDTGTYIYAPPSWQTNQLERYNTITNDLETLAAAPMNATYLHGAWKNGKLWIVLDDNNLYSYNPATDEWSLPLSAFGTSCDVASSGPASNLIYVIAQGGAFYSYDVNTNERITLTSKPNDYALGANAEFTWFGASVGFIYADSYVRSPYIYDIANGTWQALSDPHSSTSGAGHATYDSNRMRLYITGEGDSVWYYQY